MAGGIAQRFAPPARGKSAPPRNRTRTRRPRVEEWTAGRFFHGLLCRAGRGRRYKVGAGRGDRGTDTPRKGKAGGRGRGSVSGLCAMRLSRSSRRTVAPGQPQVWQDVLSPAVSAATRKRGMTTGFSRRNATGEDPVPDRMRVRRSRHFRAAPIENAIVQTQSDGIATAIVVNFVRRHLNWTEIRKRLPSPLPDQPASKFRGATSSCGSSRRFSSLIRRSRSRWTSSPAFDLFQRKSAPAMASLLRP